MIINCLASGSKGNCYLVKMGSSSFLLDAGISIEKIADRINLNELEFAFISHEHKDHSLSLKKLIFRGVKIFGGINIPKGDKNRFLSLFCGDFKMFCFDVEHGDCKNYGLIVKNVESDECLLYITDFSLCKFDLRQFKFTNVMVECNFIESMLPQIGFKERRQINTHMGLDGLQFFLDKLDLTRCKEILLLHLSENYGDNIIMGSTIFSKYKIRTGVCLQNGGIDYYG